MSEFEKILPSRLDRIDLRTLRTVRNPIIILACAWRATPLDLPPAGDGHEHRCCEAPAHLHTDPGSVHVCAVCGLTWVTPRLRR